MILEASAEGEVIWVPLVGTKSVLEIAAGKIVATVTEKIAIFSRVSYRLLRVKKYIGLCATFCVQTVRVKNTSFYYKLTVGLSSCLSTYAVGLPTFRLF